MYSNAADAACLFAQHTKNKNVSPLTPLYALTHYFRCASTTNTRDRYDILYRGERLGEIFARATTLFFHSFTVLLQTLHQFALCNHTQNHLFVSTHIKCVSAFSLLNNLCDQKGKTTGTHCSLALLYAPVRPVVQN